MSIHAAFDAFQKNDFTKALKLIRAELKTEGSPDAYNLLGVLLKRKKDPAAEEAFLNAIRTTPSFSDAWLNLGNLKREGGVSLSELEDFYRAAVQQAPVLELKALLLPILQANGKVAEAEGLAHLILKEAPGHVVANYVLATILQSAGRLKEAESHYLAVAQAPDAPAGLAANLGNVYVGLGAPEKAGPWFDRWFGQDPVAAGALYGQGLVAHLSNQLALAQEKYEACLAIQPAHPEALYHMGALLLARGKTMDEALAWFEKAAEADPNNLTAETMALRARLERCDWSVIDRAKALVTKVTNPNATGTAPSPFSFLGYPFPISEADLLRIARRRAEQIAAPVTPLPAIRPMSKARLRVGYVSSDFFNHATAHLMLGLFSRHDRQKVEVYAYSFGPDDKSDYRKRIMADVDCFRECAGLSSKAIAEQVRADGIDILVDLKGYTRDCRSDIFAYRAAPVQVQYLGYPGTMGADFIDYVITDRIVTPPETQPNFTEKLAFMPHCYQVNDIKQPIGKIPTRAEAGLPETGFVFCSFCAHYKIDPVTFGSWMEILKSVDGSVLWLIKGAPQAEENLRREAEKAGVAADRLIFAPFKDKAEHLARFTLADLFLDTCYYNGHTTASDALWAGVPVITVPGETFSSRVGASLLHAVGLPDLILPDFEAYRAKAIELARNTLALAHVRNQLSMQRFTWPLFDTKRFAVAMDALYHQMWQEQVERVAALQPAREEGGLRTRYGQCPLSCGGTSLRLKEANCTQHALHRPELPATLTWLKCDRCGHVHTDGYWTPAGLDLIFSKSHAGQQLQNDFDQQRFQWAPVVENVISALTARLQAQSWLDVGCGNGGLVLTAREFGFRAMGLDTRAETVARLKSFGAPAVQGDFMSLPADARCDVISMADVLEHMPYPLETLCKAHAMLNPNGLIYISCPNADAASWLAMDQLGTNPYWGEIEHYHNFTRESLSQLLATAGFSVVRFGINPRYKAGMYVIAQRN